MYARVTKIKTMPEKINESIRQFREETIPMVERTGGKGAYLLVDRNSGDSLAITFWETEKDMRASEEEGNRLRARAGQLGASAQPPEVERYEVAAKSGELAEYGL